MSLHATNTVRHSQVHDDHHPTHTCDSVHHSKVTLSFFDMMKGLDRAISSLFRVSHLETASHDSGCHMVDPANYATIRLVPHLLRFGCSFAHIQRVRGGDKCRQETRSHRALTPISRMWATGQALPFDSIEGERRRPYSGPAA